MLECICADRKFRQSALKAAIEDNRFWVSFAFGESWESKRKRVEAASQWKGREGWDLVGMIVKANDDVRQEVFAMQLIQLCGEVSWARCGAKRARRECFGGGV